MMGELVLREGTTPDAPGDQRAGRHRAQHGKRLSGSPQVAITLHRRRDGPARRKLATGQIYDVNAYAVGAGMVENGGVPVYLGIVRDEPRRSGTRCWPPLRAADVDPDLGQHLGRHVGHDVRHRRRHRPGARPRHQDQARQANHHRGGQRPAVHRPARLPVVGAYHLQRGGRPADPAHGRPAAGSDLPRVRAQHGRAVTSEGGREVLQPVGLVRTADGSLAAYPSRKAPAR